GEIYRYTLTTPKDPFGYDIYTLNDIKALQDWLLQREFKRVNRIVDVTGAGGTVKRYEIHPDPERLKRYGITLAQLSNALSKSNANEGGDYLRQGRMALVVRSVAVIGGGKDPVEKVLGFEKEELDKLAGEQLSAAERGRLAKQRAALRAAALLREGDQERLREIRQIVITSVNNVPILIDDIVEGGPILNGPPSTSRHERGVVVGHQTRLGKVSLARPLDHDGKRWRVEPEKVQGIVLLRKG